MAGEEWALTAFRDGRDIYVETAERMGGLTRFQGKVATLALGYAGGVGSLRAMGATGDDEELQRLVTAWRRANARIVNFWGQMEDAVDGGGQVGKHVHVKRSGTDMEIHLPSGRAICYHGVKWERYVVIDPVTEKKVFKQGWRYADPKRGGARIGTYGGRITENVTQAIARDILAGALVRLEDAGYRTVGHVHDEVIVEGEDLDGVTKLITTVPSWATGLPLDGEGYCAERYRK
jgi:DNA polymerase